MNRSKVAHYTLMVIACLILMVESTYYRSVEGKDPTVVNIVILVAWLLMYLAINRQFPHKWSSNRPNNNTPAI